MRLSRTTGLGAGLIVLLLGLWAAIIPFVGPYFHYGFSPDATWHFTLNRLWLDVLPGAAAVVGGLTMILTARRGRGVLGCWLALAGGVWLLLGPSVSMFWQHPASGQLISGIGTPIGGHDRGAVEMIGFFYGVGALVTALSAFSAARFVHRAALIADPLAQDIGTRSISARPRAAAAEERAPVGNAPRPADAAAEEVLPSEPAMGPGRPERRY
jgi:hypothetical protein